MICDAEQMRFAKLLFATSTGNDQAGGWKRIPGMQSVRSWQRNFRKMTRLVSVYRLVNRNSESGTCRQEMDISLRFSAADDILQKKEGGSRSKRNPSAEKG